MKTPSPYREPTNRYRDADLMTLAQECTRLSFDIRERKARTPDARLDLADAASDALLEFSRRLEPNPHTPHNPEDQARRDASISKAFGAWYEDSKRRERHRTIHRAAWWALRDEAQRWLSDRANGPESYARLWVAGESDEGLAEILRSLDAFPRRTD